MPRLAVPAAGAGPGVEVSVAVLVKARVVRSGRRLESLRAVSKRGVAVAVVAVAAVATVAAAVAVAAAAGPDDALAADAPELAAAVSAAVA